MKATKITMMMLMMVVVVPGKGRSKPAAEVLELATLPALEAAAKVAVAVEVQQRD